MRNHHLIHDCVNQARERELASLWMMVNCPIYWEFSSDLARMHNLLCNPLLELKLLRFNFRLSGETEAYKLQIAFPMSTGQQRQSRLYARLCVGSILMCSATSRSASGLI
jgi:hypothetical protein